MAKDSKKEFFVPDKNPLAESLFRDIGELPRVVAGIVMAALAVLCSLPVVLCFNKMVGFALAGDWNGAARMIPPQMIFGLFFVVPLFWFARRLLRGKRTANGMTVLPLWVIQVMGVLIIAGGCISLFPSDFNPKLKLGREVIVAEFLLGGAMLFVPWLARRKARQTADDAVTEETTNRGQGYQDREDTGQVIQ